MTAVVALGDKNCPHLFFFSLFVFTPQPIQSVSYEDDLDLLVVTKIRQSVSDGDSYAAEVCLHDNQTGQLVKRISLDEPWDTVCQTDSVLLVFLLELSRRLTALAFFICEFL